MRVNSEHSVQDGGCLWWGKATDRDGWGVDYTQLPSYRLDRLIYEAVLLGTQVLH